MIHFAEDPPCGLAGGRGRLQRLRAVLERRRGWRAAMLEKKSRHGAQCVEDFQPLLEAYPVSGDLAGFVVELRPDVVELPKRLLCLAHGLDYLVLGLRGAMSVER